MEEAVGYDVVDLAWSGAEDSGEVGGLVAGEGGGGGGPGVGDEAATGHAFEFSWRAKLPVMAASVDCGMTTCWVPWW